MLGILSDAHGNGPAFRLAVDRLTRLGAERFVFLGDAVGYIPSTSVVRALLEMGERVECIRGNHEDMLLLGSADSKREAVYQLSAVRQRLGDEELNYLASWPVARRVSVPSGAVLYVHGSPADPTNGYVYPDTDLSSFATDVAYVFMGHSHHPFVRRQQQTLFVNVGSCGLPRDDGRFGCAGLFDERSGGVRLVRFDIVEATAAALAEAAAVHPSVTAVFARRKERLEGEFDEC
jgi:putative phosphoesterase